MPNSNTPFAITICSGKGGVGKSVLSANLASAISKKGANVLLWDANIHFPNLHLLMGIEPPVRLNDVISGRVPINKAIYCIANNFSIIAEAPASGIQENELEYDLLDIYKELILDTNFDVVIIDTPAGAGDIVLQAANIADRIEIVITDEPTSLLDAYGLIKIFLNQINVEKINLLVNNIIDFEDGNDIATKLNMATNKFLELEIPVSGLIPYDRIVRQSILKQELFYDILPENEVAQAVEKLADNILIEIDKREENLISK